MPEPAYSFRGHTFKVNRSGMFAEMPPPPQRVEDRVHIPYSAKNIVQDGGDALSVWQVTIYCTPAERTAILADRGLIGSLVTPLQTYANAKLSQVSAQGVTIDREVWELQVEFICG
jgi:hypothetical protein